jgi:hypothetical protein
MKWLLVLGIFAVAIAGLWLMPNTRAESYGKTPRPIASDARDSSGAIGTSGTHAGAAEDAPGDTVREIETITGANDGMTFVGRRVDLHVDVQEMANDRAFWVGSADNRVLVVLGRDNRTGSQRQHGTTAAHRITPVHHGQRAMISGVVRPMPTAEEMSSWDLTTADQKELAERKIYIRADTVGSEGHGSF